MQVQAFKQARDNRIDLQIANKNFQIRPWIVFFSSFLYRNGFVQYQII